MPEYKLWSERTRSHMVLVMIASTLMKTRVWNSSDDSKSIILPMKIVNVIVRNHLDDGYDLSVTSNDNNHSSAYYAITQHLLSVKRDKMNQWVKNLYCDKRNWCQVQVLGNLKCQAPTALCWNYLIFWHYLLGNLLYYFHNNSFRFDVITFIPSKSFSLI